MVLVPETGPGSSQNPVSCNLGTTRAPPPSPMKWMQDTHGSTRRPRREHLPRDSAQDKEAGNKRVGFRPWAWPALLTGAAALSHQCHQTGREDKAGRPATPWRPTGPLSVPEAAVSTSFHVAPSGRVQASSPAGCVHEKWSMGGRWLGGSQMAVQVRSEAGTASGQLGGGAACLQPSTSDLLGGHRPALGPTSWSRCRDACE